MAIDYQKVLWDDKGPYNADPVTGAKHYIPPMTAVEMTDDPRVVAWGQSKGASYDPNNPAATTAGAPSGGLFSSRGQWNDQTGQYDQGINWGNILSLVVAGTLTAGIADAIMGAPAGTAAQALTTGVAPDGTAIADAGTATLLPSTTIGTGALAPITGGTGSALSGGISGGGVLNTLANTLPLAGKAISAATQSAGQTQLTNNDLTARAAQINNQAEQARQSDLQNLSTQEREQRASDITNLAKNSFVQNPFHSPFNPAAPQAYSPGYTEGLSDIEKQALARLAKPPTYDPTAIAPKPVTPYVPDTSQSGLQKTGNILAPTLTIAGALAPYLRYL